MRRPELADLPLRLLGSGWDNRVYAVGPDLVLRVLRSDYAAEPAHRARLVRFDQRVHEYAARRLGPLVPTVRDAWPEDGVLLTDRARGRPVRRDDCRTTEFARSLAAVLSALHDPVPAGWPAELPRQPTLQARLAQLAEAIEPVYAYFDPGLRRLAQAFLALTPPPLSDRVALCHNDVSSEHVFVDNSGRLSAIIDWSDAELADPARDFALLSGQLGERCYREVRAAYRHRVDEGFDERVGWYARWARLYDAAYAAGRADWDGLQRITQALDS